MTGPVEIRFYECSYYMFSNFSAFTVEWKGLRWMTAEHAYQAVKFFGVAEDVVQEIFEATSAHEAKQIAKRHRERRRSDWEKEKMPTMREIVWAKLMQHEYVQRKLLESNEAVLIEDSPKDSFWGCGPYGNGRNELGKIWMWARERFFQMLNQRRA